MSELNQESLEEAILKIKESAYMVAVKPTKLLIPAKTMEYLHSQGYETQEQIEGLVKNLVDKNSSKWDT